MKKLVRYLLHDFQGFTGVYLVITSIRHMLSHTIPTETAVFLIIIGIINVVLDAKNQVNNN